jgi:hypothetical protein
MSPTSYQLLYPATLRQSAAKDMISQNKDARQQFFVWFANDLQPLGKAVFTEQSRVLDILNTWDAHCRRGRFVVKRWDTCYN